MRRVFISYERKDTTFVQRLVDTLKNANFEVQYDQNLYPSDVWKDKLAGIAGNWADCCIFVVSSAFNESVFIRENEVPWARLRESQLHRMFKSFVVKLEHGCVVGDFARVQSADFTGWEDESNYQRGWLQLSHHLHHHQLYPDLFVGRERESAACAAVLRRPLSPGAIIFNQVGKQGRRQRGMGNSMLLWHLEEGYLPEILVDTQYVIVPLDWNHLVQKTGPVELLNYTANMLRPLQVDFRHFDAALSELTQQSRDTKVRVRYTKGLYGSTIAPQMGVNGLRFEDQGRLSGLSNPDDFDNRSYLEEEQNLWTLTEAFLQDACGEEKPTIVWLVNGPSDNDWVSSLRLRHRWLESIFMKLPSAPNMWMIAAGTYPMLSRPDISLMLELPPLGVKDVSLYVEKRLHGVKDPRLHAIVGYMLWKKTKGHPATMHQEFESVLHDVDIQAYL